jgi:hypothetical protein
MKVLFVTSFHLEMFAVTGRRLVESFLESGTKGNLLMCHEGFDGVRPLRHRRLRVYDLGRSLLLQSWLRDNADIIPKRFGGLAGECACAKPTDPFARHNTGCPGGWYNRNAARWFRKVVSLNAAIERTEYDAYVWLDSDCVFTARLPFDELATWFNRGAVLYLKSPARGVIESGVMGILNCAQGRKFVRATVERFQSGEFRRDVRWDDGYQFQLTLHRHPEIQGVDLATTANQNADVVPFSSWGAYLCHRKGTHATTLRLV